MAHFVSPTVRAIYEDKSVAELRELLARVEASGKKAKEAMHTADGNRVVSVGMDRGRWTNVTAAEASYNSCRGMWKDVATILREKEAA